MRNYLKLVLGPFLAAQGIRMITDPRGASPLLNYALAGVVLAGAVLIFAEGVQAIRKND